MLPVRVLFYAFIFSDMFFLRHSFYPNKIFYLNKLFYLNSDKPSPSPHKPAILHSSATFELPFRRFSAFSGKKQNQCIK
ncbi:hypothetical protein Q7O_002483 [Pectobacterium carotovorum subsp. carotovorum PCCS1]|nr:hypothetical protein [Pectobacterium carotovorum subsp. carotovorum PCCS1]